MYLAMVMMMLMMLMAMKLMMGLQILGRGSCTALACGLGLVGWAKAECLAALFGSNLSTMSDERLPMLVEKGT
jgi:hypothetical protein